MHLPLDKQQTDYDDWICPDLGEYWKLGRVKGSDKIVLRAKETSEKHLFSPTEGHILRHFTGKTTVEQIQNLTQQEFPQVESNVVVELLQKLINLGIIEIADEPENNNAPSSYLKPSVEWIPHPQGYWILRNSEELNYQMQVSDHDKAIIEKLGTKPTPEIAQQFNVSPEKIKQLLQMLATTGMLIGTQPAKPKRGKFNPLQLLFFKLPLFNPDPWLTHHVGKLSFLWTRTCAFLLCLFLTISCLIGLNQRLEISQMGQQLLLAYGSNLLIPFILLTILVVTLHELGHAFTLKHYGGVVPDMGLLFMVLIPTAYTNTTDSYSLSRKQRVLVVGAGVLVQLIIASVALLLWNFAVDGSWLKTSSLLLMAAALFTIALNLNPLAKFDGYYLAVALTGINNLRSRAFGFYGNLLRGKPIKESRRNITILATYAPFSLAYIWFIFGFLFWRITDWTIMNIPMTALILLAIWAIYFYFPRDQQKA